MGTATTVFLATSSLTATAGFPDRFAFRPVQTSRRRLAMTNRHGQNIYTNPGARIFKEIAKDFPYPSERAHGVILFASGGARLVSDVRYAATSV
jgi:hypothetical protein